MSEIRATTISDAAGTGPVTLTGQSAAKAWGSAITNTTPATLSGNLNVSSFLDSGTGDFTFSFSNAMLNTEYNVLSGCGGGSLISVIVPTPKVVGSQSVLAVDSSGAAVDGSHVYIAIHGDLA